MQCKICQEMSFSELNKNNVFSNVAKYLKAHHSTVKLWQVLNFQKWQNSTFNGLCFANGQFMLPVIFLSSI